MLNILTTPIISGLSTPTFAAILILAGLYSLIFNVSAARQKNFRRAGILACVGGWCYIIAGAAIAIWQLF